MAVFVYLGVCALLLIARIGSVPVHSPFENTELFGLIQQLPSGRSGVSDVGGETNEAQATTATLLSSDNSLEKVKVRRKRDTSPSITTLQNSTSNLQNRSVCPWTYSINTNASRQPADLIVATCIKRLVDGTSNACEHVYYYVPVKRKQTSATGTVTWIDDWEWIPTGCTLAIPPIQPANSAGGSNGSPTLD